MTVQSTTARAQYNGNGATTLFTVPFYFLDPTHLKVLRIDNSVSPATSALLVLNADYTVTGAGVQQGGSIQTTVAPTATQQIIILRNVPFTQLIHYVPNDPFPAATHEQALDQLTMEVQELNEGLNHAVQFPTYEPAPATLLPAAQRASMVLGFDPLGNITYLPIPATAGAGDLRTDVFVANVGGQFSFVPGTTTSITLSRAPSTPGNVGIHFDTKFQGPDQWTLNGTVVTFSSPIPVGIQKVYATTGTTVSPTVPPTGSVGDTQLAWGTVLNRVVDSVAALSALNPATYQRAFLTGYYAAGDGGGGAYFYSASTSQASANGGTIIAASGGTGCWLLEVNGTISVRQFGAKGDGVTDDAPAFRAALAATPIGGTLFVPTGIYLMNSAVNNAILDFTPFPNKGITIRGVGWTLKTGGSFSFGAGTGPQGSILRMGSAILNTIDFYHQKPTDLVIGGVVFRDFAIVANTGAYGVAYGQNGFNFDGGSNGYIENLIMENVFIDNMAAGSSILVNGVGNTYGVLAGAVFRNNKFMNFYAPAFGDSNTIEDNVIGANAGATGAVGINFYNVSGATNTRILNNDMVNFNGMILCNGATKPIIDGNEFEQSTGSSNSLGALISLNGAYGAIDTPTITNNSISQNSAVANYTPLIIGNSNGARVSGNRISTLSAYAHISISANSSYTLVESDNQSWVNGVVQDGVSLTDLGTKSMLRAAGWSSFTPTVTAGSGAFGSVTATCATRLLDTRTLAVRMSITINTVGTASGAVQVAIPAILTAAAAQTLSGKEVANTGKALAANIAASGSTVAISAADGTSIIAAGNQLVVTGIIEIQ